MEASEQLLRDLAKYQCPVRYKILDNVESAHIYSMFVPQVHKFQLEQHYDIVLSMLLSKFHKLNRSLVHTRKCQVVQLSPKERDCFYNTTHVQGTGQGISRALVYGSTVIAQMSFKRSASNTSAAGFWELNRFSTSLKFYAKGAFEKLLQSFIKEFDIQSVVSYADKMVSDGSLYYKQGFRLAGELAPDYRYWYEGRLQHKFNFRIKRFREDSKLLFKEGLTESQLAKINFIPRVYDIGKLRFLFFAIK